MTTASTSLFSAPACVIQIRLLYAYGNANVHCSFFPLRKSTTVNMAFNERALSEREHSVNGFKRDRLTPSKEQRAKEASIERTRAFSERTLRLRSVFTQCHVDCTSLTACYTFESHGHCAGDLDLTPKSGS